MVSHAASETLTPEPAVRSDSNWIALYVFLCLVPVVFVGIALYSRNQGQRRATEIDPEAMKAHYAQYWRKTVNNADRDRHNQAQSSRRTYYQQQQHASFQPPVAQMNHYNNSYTVPSTSAQPAYTDNALGLIQEQQQQQRKHQAPLPIVTVEQWDKDSGPTNYSQGSWKKASAVKDEEEFQQVNLSKI